MDPEWVKANIERVTAHQRKKPEQARERYRRWRERHPDKVAAAWAKLAVSPLYRRAKNVNRKTRKKVNGGHCSATDIAEIKDRQNGRCAECGKRAKAMHIDHIVPIARGGTSDKRNLQLLCKACNLRKADKDPIHFARERGRLC